MGTSVLFFSKNRAMQLDAAIRSCRLHCEDLSHVKKAVIFKATSELAVEQYRQLQIENPDFQFVKEIRIAQQIIDLSIDSEFTSFQCDDNMYIRDFTFAESVKILLENKLVLGYTFRLGKNVVWSYCRARPIIQPIFSEMGEDTLLWNWFELSQEGGFGYPFEVSASIYRSAQLLPLVKQHLDSGISHLEYHLMSHCKSFAHCPLFTCKQLPSAISVPVNRVGIINNLHGQKYSYSSKDLAVKFSENFRIDITPYSDFNSNSCHEELQFTFVKRGEDNERVE